MFRQGIPEDEILVTKHVYPYVARRLNKTTLAAARAVQRTANLCWSRMTDAQKLVYIGRNLDDIASLTELIIYLAYYVYYGRPYYVVIRSSL